MSRKQASKAAVYLGLVLLISSFAQCLPAASADPRQIGSGSDDWWTIPPYQSSDSAPEIQHPAWVLETLKDKPVLIYVHKGCSYCKPQNEAMAEIAQEYGDRIAIYDIAGDGTDFKAEESFMAYDPNGGANYVPLTAIVTLAPGPDGDVQVVWHSSEDVTGKDWIRNYVEDALYYHEQNSASWKQ